MIKLKIPGFKEASGGILLVTARSRGISFDLDEKAHQAPDNRLVGQRAAA